MRDSGFGKSFMMEGGESGWTKKSGRYGLVGIAGVDIDEGLTVVNFALEQVGFPHQQRQGRTGSVARKAAKAIDLNFVLSGKYLNLARVVCKTRYAELLLFAWPRGVKF